jgi:hypothetical protein
MVRFRDEAIKCRRPRNQLACLPVKWAAFHSNHRQWHHILVLAVVTVVMFLVCPDRNQHRLGAFPV